ncbi:MAG: alpha/beta hydrolase [Steroidobacteraceae bacterium]
MASAVLIFQPAAGASLPRINRATVEPLAHVDTAFEELKVPQGYRLRFIKTRPHGARGRLPAVYFVQWLSCDSVEIGRSEDGWTAMLKSLVRDSGMVVARTEKAGVGDSEGGPCSALDYDTELAHHRLALERLFSDPWIDPQRVIVFGASMGANFAPLVAADHPVKAVAVWGGGAQSWFERQLGFERRTLELSGKSGAEIDERMRKLSQFYARVLLDGQTPAQIAQRDPSLGATWMAVSGASGETQFGRPIAFHQQAQHQYWAQAWAALDAPVLALFGQFDWYEAPEGVRLIGEVVNRAHPGRAQVQIVAGLDHHFMRYASEADAFADRGGVPDAPAVMSVLLPWLKQHAN